MKTLNKFTLGLIINPISGMGGAVGLKGTYGKKILEKAIKLGAKPNALNRTKEVLNELKSIKSKLKFITCPRFMGEFILKEINFEYEIIKDPIFKGSEELFDTTADHTKIAAKIMKKSDDIKLLLFTGGDGTARDIQSVINIEKPCLGIPAGVKIYSSVFSINPKLASSIIIQFLWDEIPLKVSEVLDIDEDEYRKGKLVSKLYGYFHTPYNPDYLQFSKIGSRDSDLNNQERIAKRVIETLEKDIYYLIGPGTTTKAITDKLNQKKTVLGVDLLLNNKIIALDLNEKQILDFIEGKKAKIIISLIGRQGFLFGRGNLQFTPTILNKIGPKNIIIISTKYKLQNIPKQILRLDTRSYELDKKMRGLYKILVDYDEIIICKVE
ncbi:MAG: ATP-NAD kinase family protein [Candidatus Thorarchaeota archaeon]